MFGLWGAGHGGAGRGGVDVNNLTSELVFNFSRTFSSSQNELFHAFDPRRDLTSESYNLPRSGYRGCVFVCVHSGILNNVIGNYLYQPVNDSGENEK